MLLVPVMALMVLNMCPTALLPPRVTEVVVRTIGLLTIGLEHGRLTLMVLMLRLITAPKVLSEMLGPGKLQGRQLTKVGPPLVPNPANTVFDPSGPRSTFSGRLDGAAVLPATTNNSSPPPR